LIGQSQKAYDVFEGIAWSEESVFAKTKELLQKNGWKHAELEPLSDVDYVEDLQKFFKEEQNIAKSLKLIKKLI